LYLRQRGFLGGEITAVGVAFRELPAQNIEHL
jgi:hypothetical protein